MKIVALAAAAVLACLSGTRAETVAVPDAGSGPLAGAAVYGAAPLTHLDNQPMGYASLPGGELLEWGYGTTNSSGVLAVTLPVPCPNYLAGFSPVIFGATSAPTSPFTVTIGVAGNQALTGTNVYVSSSSGPGASVNVTWTALCY